MFFDTYKKLCEDKKVRPFALPMKLGIAKSNSIVAQWQKGSIPRRKTLEVLADYFDVTVAYLMGIEENARKGIGDKGDVFVFRYDRLEELIKESGKKKIYLCSKLQKCPTYLRDAKKQNTNIKPEDVAILASELNTTPEYLTGASDEKNPSPLANSKMVSDLRKEAIDFIFGLNEIELERFIKIIHVLEDK